LPPVNNKFLIAVENFLEQKNLPVNTANSEKSGGDAGFGDVTFFDLILTQLKPFWLEKQFRDILEI